MAEVEKFRVALFDGNNFDNWKFRLEVVLDESGLLEYIEKDVNDTVQFLTNQENIDLHRKNDKKCKSIIIRRIADSHLEYVKDKKTSMEVIQALKKTFERKSLASQLYLRRKLLTLKCAEGEDLGNLTRL